GIAWSACSLGTVACAQGDRVAARELLVKSLVIQQELGDPEGISDALDGLAEVDSAAGNVTSAARLWGVAERLREGIGAPLAASARNRNQEQVAAARAILGEDAAFDAVWGEGRAMTLERAIELATENSR